MGFWILFVWNRLCMNDVCWNVASTRSWNRLFTKLVSKNFYPVFFRYNFFLWIRIAGKRRYNIKLWKTFTDCFNCLPIAAIIDEKIFCCHGGLSPDLQGMEQIRRIMRPTDVPDTGNARFAAPRIYDKCHPLNLWIISFGKVKWINCFKKF